MCFSWESKQAVLFHFEIGEVGVAPNSAHYPEGLHLGVPLLEIEQLFEHCLN